MTNKGPFKKSKNIVSRQIGTETILLPIFKNTEELNCIYTLNKSAARVWELIDGNRTFDAIEKEIKKEFEVDDKKLAAQLDLIFKDLKEIKAIT